jgi:hypothetical protein
MRSGSKQLIFFLVGTLLLSSLTALTLMTTQVLAAPVEKVNPDNPQAQHISDLTGTGPIVSNEVCLGCHGKPGLSMNLSNGDILDLHVDPDNYVASVHGKDGYACVQCHTTLGNYPHPVFSATDLRDVTLQLTSVCTAAIQRIQLTMDSVHTAAQAAGKREAAVCSDCHGSHYVHQWTDPQTGVILAEARLDIPITCSHCHFAIYQKYRSSVHGAALTEEGNTDVPTCIDCHGVHNIATPPRLLSA